MALLSGDALDLEVNEKTEVEKNKAWWEGGNTTRRRSSVKHRKAEAYDGEYDDNSGMQPKISVTKNCKGRISERQCRENMVALKSHPYVGYDRKIRSKDMREIETSLSDQNSSK